MSLTFTGMSKDAKGSQIRTAGLWNIAVAIERLREELEYARKESHKAHPILAAELFDFRAYRSALRSGAALSRTPVAISVEWVVVKKADSTRACLAVHCIESIVEEALDP